MSYDGFTRNVSIVETRSGLVDSVEQFVWCGDQRSEARNSAGGISTQYFSKGQMFSGSSYFYSKDHLGSIRELTDNSTNVQAQYSYDLFGHVTNLRGSMASVFEYADYFYHAPSQLGLALHRAYRADMGRWLSRDPIAENGGMNLYTYLLNEPSSDSDPSGLAASPECCKAKDDTIRLVEELQTRISEQESGSSDPGVVKGHQKAFRGKQVALNDALRRWRKYCKDDPPPKNYEDLGTAPAPVPKPANSDGSRNPNFFFPVPGLFPGMPTIPELPSLPIPLPI